MLSPSRRKIRGMSEGGDLGLRDKLCYVLLACMGDRISNGAVD